MAVKIDLNQCTGCGNCVSFCPKSLLELSKNEKNRRDVNFVKIKNSNECVDCGRCELMCNAGALHVETIESGYQLIDKENIPAHSGCYLGSLAKALADVVYKMKIAKDVVVFKKNGSVVNLHVENHDYTSDEFFQDGLDYKIQHPEKIVIIIAACSKEKSTAMLEEKYRNLTNEKVTIINTSNWFEADENFTKLTAGKCHIAEELGESNYPSFVVRDAAKTPEQIIQLEKDIQYAIECQLNNRSYSFVEVVFPCFYRLSGRPQKLMSADNLNIVKNWFEKNVETEYKGKIFKK